MIKQTSLFRSPFISLILTGLALVSLCLIVFLTYWKVLGLPFTGIDDYYLIDTNRIQSIGDFVRIFTSPLFPNSGSNFQITGSFYRPISRLTYSLDYSIWGLNPFGYHLTDLVLHSINSVLAYFLLKTLTKGKRLLAWTGAAIFATHPLLFEILPSPTRRQDMLATMFLFVALIFFVKYATSAPKKNYFQYLSGVAFIFAFLSKEVAIIFPVLALAYLFLITFSDVRPYGRRGLSVINKGRFIIILSAVMVFTRAFLIERRFASYQYSSFLERLKVGKERVWQFAEHLLYPGSRFAPLTEPYPGILKKIVSLLLLTGILLFLLLFGRALCKLILRKERHAVAVIEIALSVITLLPLILIVTYPLLASSINQILQYAYNGQGYHLLAATLGMRQDMPFEIYLYRFGNWYVSLLSMGFFLSAVMLTIMFQRKRLKAYFRETGNGRLLSFLLSWLLTCLLLFLSIRMFGFYYNYIALFPWCAILAILLFELAHASRRIYQQILPLSFVSRLPGKLVTLGVIIIAVLGFYAVNSFPFSRGFSEWEICGGIKSKFYAELPAFIGNSPNDRDRKSTRLNSSHTDISRMPSSA